MIKGLFKGGLLKEVSKITEVFKDNKGRFSSKRTVAGIIAGAGAAVITQLSMEALTVAQVLLPLGCFAIAGAILLFAPVTEKYTQDQYPVE